MLTLFGIEILFSLNACRLPTAIGSDAMKKAVGRSSFKVEMAFFATV